MLFATFATADDPFPIECCRMVEYIRTFFCVFLSLSLPNGLLSLHSIHRCRRPHPHPLLAFSAFDSLLSHYSIQSFRRIIFRWIFLDGIVICCHTVTVAAAAAASFAYFIRNRNTSPSSRAVARILNAYAIWIGISFWMTAALCAGHSVARTTNQQRAQQHNKISIYYD